MSQLLYVEILKSIEDNLSSYNFKEGKTLEDVNYTIDNFSSNVDEIYPAACTCGKRITDTIINEYEDRKKFLATNPSAIQISEYNKNSRITRLCCLNTLGSKMPIEHNITSTYSVNTGIYNNKDINRNKNKLVERVAALLYSKSKSEIISTVKDLSNTSLEKYTIQEIDEIFDLADALLAEDIYEQFYHLFNEYEPKIVRKKMERSLDSLLLVNRFYTSMLKDYSKEELNRLKKKYKSDEALRKRIKDDEYIPEELGRRYLEGRDNSKETDKFFLKLMEDKVEPTGKIRVIDLSDYK